MKKVIFLLIAIGFGGCNDKKPEEYNKTANNPEFVHQAFENLTDVMIHDTFSPPVSARIYAYASIAGYEALIAGNKDYKSIGGQIKDLKEFPKIQNGQEFCGTIASVQAIMTIARKLTFTVDKYDEFEKQILKKYKDAGVPNSVIESSMEFGEKIAEHVIGFSKGDNYLQTRGLRYSVKGGTEKWQPTPPTYTDAMEPYWNTIRPMVIDSAGQFKAAPVIPYSKDKNTGFWKELNAVYNTVNNLTQEQKDIAWFWDDNAFVMNVQGHVAYANKKMSPAGHWMAITRTVSQQQNKNVYEVAEAYLKISLSFYDAFICSWNEKFKSEKIRPESVINAEIDPKWIPFLQTPPFPEYTSGHSTISAASAETLTSLFGDNLAFIDSTELKYDHGVRKFSSFRQAAEECSISRVYGGIHYTSGCEEGQKVGIKIGQYVSQKIITRNK
jgi:PAP2 superfamily